MELLPDISFKDDLGIDLTHPAQFVMRFEGNSDIPGCQKGDLLLIDRKLNPENNNVVVAAVNGEFLLCLYVVEGSDKFLLKKKEKITDFEIWGVVSNSVHGLKKN